MFVSASFELATVETLVFSLNAIYMNQKAKTSNCSAEDRDGMDCPCRHPIFKTSRKTWTPKWIQIVSKNQLTWTQCGPNKQRCFRLRFDLYPQNASEWPPKGRGFSPKKTTPVLFIKAISSLCRPHPRQSILHPGQSKKWREKCQSVRCHIETTVIPSVQIQYTQYTFRKGNLFCEGPRGQQNPNGWASAITDKSDFSYVDESIKQNGPRWWRHCKLPRCLNDMTVESLHCVIWLFGFTRLMNLRMLLIDYNHSDMETSPGNGHFPTNASVWVLLFVGERVLLKNPLHLYRGIWGQNDEVTFPTENIISNSF